MTVEPSSALLPAPGPAQDAVPGGDVDHALDRDLEAVLLERRLRRDQLGVDHRRYELLLGPRNDQHDRDDDQRDEQAADQGHQRAAARVAQPVRDRSESLAHRAGRLRTDRARPRSRGSRIGGGGGGVGSSCEPYGARERIRRARRSRSIRTSRRWRRKRIRRLRSARARRRRGRRPPDGSHRSATLRPTRQPPAPAAPSRAPFRWPGVLPVGARRGQPRPVEAGLHSRREREAAAALAGLDGHGDLRPPAHRAQLEPRTRRDGGAEGDRGVASVERGDRPPAVGDAQRAAPRRREPNVTASARGPTTETMRTRSLPSRRPGTLRPRSTRRPWARRTARRWRARRRRRSRPRRVPATVVIRPCRTRRMRLLWVSAIRKPPSGNAATECGSSSSALLARPPSPAEPGRPSPATVVIRPEAETLRIAMLPASATRNPPPGSGETSKGWSSCARVAAPPSPL